MANFNYFPHKPGAVVRKQRVMASLPQSNSTNQTNTSASFSNKPNDVAHFVSILWHFQVVFLCFTIFAALLGNVLVLLATYLDRRLHNANKYFVACLAASDLLVAMFSVTIRLHQYLVDERPLTIEFCRFWIWVDIFSEAASITTVTIISMDRYYKVSRPFRYKTSMTTHRARRIIAFIWIYSAILGFLGLFPYAGTKGVHISTNNQCVNDNRTFYTLAALLGFFIPVIILVILCILIFRIVQVHSRKRLSSVRNVNDPEIARIHQKQTHSSGRRGFGTLALIVVTFIICWGPFFVIFLIYQYNPGLIPSSIGTRGFIVLHSVCFGVLPYANSFLNPVIYAFCDKTFNVAIKTTLSKLWRGLNHGHSGYKTTNSIGMTRHFSQ